MDRFALLLDRLDFTIPGLDKALELYNAGDKTAAADAVADYFKTRKGPKYLFDETDIAKFTDTSVIKAADDICRHFMLGKELGENIDWRKNYDEEQHDFEWIWSISRTLYWQPLARAYALTGDEKYAKEFVTQFKQFVEAWPMDEYFGTLDEYGKQKVMTPHCWRTIEVGIRLYACWIPIMEYFKKSPTLDGEFYMWFLNSLYEQGLFAQTYYSFHKSCPNWISMEGTGLFTLGVMYPEYKAAEKWKKLGYQRVTQECKFQFDIRGCHLERTPIYHLTAANAFTMAYRLVILNDIPAPRFMLPTLEKAAEHLMSLVKPDMTTPMIGDADRNSLLTPIADESVYEGMNNTMDAQDANEIRAYYRVMHELTGREDFLWMATGKKEGKAPDIGHYFNDDSGHYIFRTGWEDNDSYTSLIATMLEGGVSLVHTHEDNGHLEIQVEGEDVLMDSGRYLYRTIDEVRWREYFIGFKAHNVAVVDNYRAGTGYKTYAGRRISRALCTRREDHGDYWFIELCHNGFAPLEESVTATRRVLNVKNRAWIIEDSFEGLGEHEYAQYFNFASDKVEAAGDNAYVFTGTKRKYNLKPLTDIESTYLKCGDDTPNEEGGWISYGYSVKYPIGQVCYKTHGGTPYRMITALYTDDAKIDFSEEGDKACVRVQVGDTKVTAEFTQENCELIKG